jgi:hypothetical protein
VSLTSIGDGHVLTWNELMRAETVSGLVVGAARVVVKNPTSVFAAARFVDQKTRLIVFAGPETPDTALGAYVRHISGSI